MAWCTEVFKGSYWLIWVCLAKYDDDDSECALRSCRVSSQALVWDFNVNSRTWCNGILIEDTHAVIIYEYLQWGSISNLRFDVQIH